MRQFDGVDTTRPAPYLSARSGGISASCNVLVVPLYQPSDGSHDPTREDHLTESIGNTPIPGDSPAGASVRYEPEYEEIDNEIKKLESVDQVEVDWKRVGDLATLLLTTKGKDMLLTSYLCMARYQQTGFAGLKEGLQIASDMCTTFWEDMQPPKRRARARGGSFDWLKDRLTPIVEKASTPPASDRQMMTELVQLFRDLQAYLDPLLGQDTPGLGPLRRAVDNKLPEIPADAPAPAPPPPAPAAPAPAAAPAAAAPAAVAAAPAPSAPPPPPAPSAPSAGSDLTKVFGSVDQASETLIACADLIFAADVANPESYSLRRFATWAKSRFGEIRKPEGGKLSFPGNKMGLNEELDLLLEGEEFAQVVQRAEPQCSQRPFWLDPHHYVFRALVGLGKRYAKAAEAVHGQVQAFVDRHPSILELSFSNDAPLASGPTRLWLTQSSSGGGASANGDGGGGGIEQVMEAALGQGRTLLLQGEFAKAVAAVREVLDELPGRRGDFLSRLAMARLCLEGDKPDLARSQLNRLQSECERYALEDWEPDLAVQLLRVHWQSLKNQPDDQDAADKLFERLCGLDLEAALALKTQ